MQSSACWSCVCMHIMRTLSECYYIIYYYLLPCIAFIYCIQVVWSRFYSTASVQDKGTGVEFAKSFEQDICFPEREEECECS